MELTAAQLRYLLAVYQLGKAGAVRSAAIAGYLCVARPSVHRMIRQLAEMGLLNKKRYSLVAMTEGGRALAEKYHHSFIRIRGLLQEGLGQELLEAAIPTPDNS